MVKYFLPCSEIAQMSANVVGIDLNSFGFPHQNKHMCSALYTAHGWQTHRAWVDGQKYREVCAERMDSLN